MTDISKNIRASVPEFIKKPLRPFLRMKREIAEYPLIRKQPRLHEKALEIVRKKKVVTVAFFATHSSVWKYDGVYELMAQDPRFNPVVVVCPVVNYGRENMIFEMEKAYNLFASKGLNVIKTFNEQTNTYLDVKKEIAPDIIFYTNPYKGLIKDEYYITNFLDTLTCYVNYAFYIGNMHHYSFYGSLFRSLLWRDYHETNLHLEMAKPYSRCRQRNALVTGYPGIDNLQYGIRLENNLWKDDDITKKRIIWAPHHTIDFRERVGFSCFLRYYETMIDIAKEFEDRIQVSFKPHPLLKNKLYDHPQWGREVTDQYYRRWEELDNGQVNTDDYVDLFNSSDALIHDSGSFVAEYLSCGKPALFTISDDSVTQRFNEFGKIALDRYYQAFNESDIESFVELVIGEREDTKRNERDEFYKTYLLPKNSKKASVNIFEDICREVFLK